jgi:hypothetical protein
VCASLHYIDVSLWPPVLVQDWLSKMYFDDGSTAFLHYGQIFRKREIDGAQLSIKCSSRSGLNNLNITDEEHIRVILEAIEVLQITRGLYIRYVY